MCHCILKISKGLLPDNSVKIEYSIHIVWIIKYKGCLIKRKVSVVAGSLFRSGGVQALLVPGYDVTAVVLALFEDFRDVRHQVDSFRLSDLSSLLSSFLILTFPFFFHLILLQFLRSFFFHCYNSFGSSSIVCFLLCFFISCFFLLCRSLRILSEVRSNSDNLCLL